MKRLKILVILVGLFLFERTNAQTFTVGDISSNYVYANKTFTTPTTYGLYSDFFYLDIDGDLNNDIGIRSQHFSCQIVPSGWCTGQWGNDITITLANNVDFVYTTPTTTLCTSNIIKNLSFGSPLNSGLNWGSAQTIFSAGVGYYCGQQIDPFYVGFRKKLPSNDTIYGWIHVDSNFPGKVIEYAYTCGTYTNAPPTSTITTAPVSMCKGDSIALNANPGGGFFSGQGVSGNYFKTKNLAAGVYTVNYNLPNPSGCSTISSNITFTVYYVAPQFLNLPKTICEYSDSVVINVNPPGGTFNNDPAIVGNTFYSSLATWKGNHPISYTCTPTGCTNTVVISSYIHADPCVGIKEINSTASSFKIFPNPNNGEFEIKGTKEETIYITNELGQLFEPKILNTQNNYTVKVNNLASGVYFVGTNYSKQKIVVIK